MPQNIPCPMFERFGRGGGEGGQKQRTLMRCLAAWGDAYKQRDSVISAHPAIRDASCVAHTQEKKRRNKGRGTGSDRERLIERERERQGARKEQRRKTKRLSEKMINDSSHFTSFRSLPPSLYSIVFFYQSIICEDNAKRQPGLVI